MNKKRKQDREQAWQDAYDYLENLPPYVISPYSIYVDSMMRFQALMDFFKYIEDIGEIISDKKYWSIIGITWSGCDNRVEYQEGVKCLFRSKRKFRQYLMSSEDESYLKNLPDEITIYRGMTVDEFKSGDFGISWSLKKKVANFFTRYPRNYQAYDLPKTICELKIKKRDVIAFLNTRNEVEIIYDYASHKNKIQMKPKSHIVKQFHIT